jgi:hypothetical protein
MLCRLDHERNSENSGMGSPAYGWMYRLNSLGLLMEHLPGLWKTWWDLETPGRAVSALQYCSGLMYLEGENPLFEMWTPERGGGGPYLWDNDSLVYDRGWTDSNVGFISEYLTSTRVADVVRQAAKRLAKEAEGETAAQIAAQIDETMELIELRVKELPMLLSCNESTGWTV